MITRGSQQRRSTGCRKLMSTILRTQKTKTRELVKFSRELEHGKEIVSRISLIKDKGTMLGYGGFIDVGFWPIGLCI
jgi:hypothetical protein